MKQKGTYLKLEPYIPTLETLIKESYSPKEKLGKLLFHDVGLSKEGNISCATCHVPEGNFHDINNVSEIIKFSSIRPPSLRGMNEQNWFIWNGRADSLWAQTLDALFSDHDLSDQEIVEYVCVKATLKNSPLNSYFAREPTIPDTA